MTMDQKTIGFAIVGTGAIARVHARAIAAVPDARLVAVCNQIPARAEAFAAEFGGDAEPTLDALLARADVDVVCVAVPSGLHGAVTLQALGRGKHVMCEKPLEISTARIDEMIAAATRAGRILAGVFQLRCSPAAQRLKRAVDTGRFGKLSLCSVHQKWWRDRDYYAGSTWKGSAALDGGGALMNQGIHAIDLLQWLVGMPSSVTAQTRTRIHSIETEDTAVALLDFDGGAMGVIEAGTSCYPGSQMRIELTGEKGTAVLANDALVDWRFADPLPDDAEVLAGPTASRNSGASDPKAIGSDGHRQLVADLVNAIRTNTEPLVPASQARNAVALIEAIYRSQQSGSRVAVR